MPPSEQPSASPDDTSDSDTATSPDVPPGLDAHAVELDGTDPDAELDDLGPVADALAEKTVVGLGEATHGTREFFRAKHRLVRLLVERLGVRLVGLEANFAETLAINDYVVRGEGDSEDALAGVNFWTWNTEEVLALIEWLREFNEGRDPNDRVRFYGYDAQYTGGPAEAIERYLGDADPALLEANRDDLQTLADEGLRTGDEATLERRLAVAEDLCDTLTERLRDRKDECVERTSEAEWKLATRQVRTLQQAVELTALDASETTDDAATVRARDEFMAENVSWILDHESADGIALWAHNEHVKTGESRGHWGSAETMGQHLRREFGDRYYALGFEFGSGSVRALTDPDAEGETELREFTVDEPFGGGIAATLSELGGSPLFLDFESASADPRVAEWLDGDHRLHSVGSVFYPDPAKNRSRYALADELDGLLYVDATTSAVGVNETS